MSDDAFTQTRRILRVLLDEHKAPPMALVALANLRRIEDHHRFLSQRIATLEAQRESVADVASEGDVEDLLDALDNLSADPKDGEVWGGRYQTAGALHDSWQDERRRRMQAEEDAERWHRLFDEGATLTAEKDAQLAAASDRYARAVADADEVKGRLVAEAADLRARLDAAERDNATLRHDARTHQQDRDALSDVSALLEGREPPSDRRIGYAEVRGVRALLSEHRAALADVARLKAERDEANAALEYSRDAMQSLVDSENAMRAALAASPRTPTPEVLRAAERIGELARGDEVWWATLANADLGMPAHVRIESRDEKGRRMVQFVGLQCTPSLNPNAIATVIAECRTLAVVLAEWVKGGGQ